MEGRKEGWDERKEERKRWKEGIEGRKEGGGRKGWKDGREGRKAG